jgi:glycosyltransferase involved in cell wall biosynthesis
MGDRTIANAGARPGPPTKAGLDAAKVLVLSTRSTSPGQRFRIENWTPALEREGIRVTSYPFATPALEELLGGEGARLMKTWRTAAAAVRYPFRFPDLSEHDALLVYRAAVPAGIPVIERWLGRASVPIALDIDDPIFFGTPGSANPLSRLSGDRKWKQLCSTATITLCINERIASYLEPYCREVAVVPNLIDMDRYPLRNQAPRQGPPVIGFHGSPTTVVQLKEIQGPLDRVAAEVPFALHVVGGRSPLGTRAYPVVEPTWTPENEVRLLHSFDVGLAPAAPEEWSRFKSFVKILVYMSVGVPVVASPVGSAPEVIQDGENGFLASSEDEWAEKLLTLVRDGELRRRMGIAARRTIERDHSLEGRIDEVVELFKRLTRNGR